MRYFAHAMPGLGEVLRDEIEPMGATERVTSDGRNDVVAFEAPSAPVHLRTAEDVFAEIGAARAVEELRAIVEATATEAGLERALSVYAAVATPLRRRMRFRVVARMRSERSFRRTQLRDAMRERIRRLRPAWDEADPAPLEIWMAQCADTWRLGLRLTGAGRSRRTTREAERPGALRPSVAAAMVRLAGGPTGWMCDPFCGSGTIVTEAAAVGWTATGADIDPSAVAAARRNGASRVVVADARHGPFPDGTFASVASNLPFGHRFPIPRPAVRFSDEVARELSRLVRPGGRLVLLSSVPAIERSLEAREDLTVEGRRDVRLLGRRTSLLELRGNRA